MSKFDPDSHVRINNWETLISLPKGSRLDEIHVGGKIYHKYKLGDVHTDRQVCEIGYLDEQKPFLLTKSHYESCMDSGVVLYHVRPPNVFDSDLFKIS